MFGKRRGVPSLFPLFNVHEIFVLTLNHLFFYSFTNPGVQKLSMITFVGGSKFTKGGPNPLANMDSRGSLSASGFGPGGPYPLADLDRGDQIQGGPNPLGHRLLLKPL